MSGMTFREAWESGLLFDSDDEPTYVGNYFDSDNLCLFCEQHHFTADSYCHAHVLASILDELAPSFCTATHSTFYASEVCSRCRWDRWRDDFHGWS